MAEGLAARWREKRPEEIRAAMALGAFLFWDQAAAKLVEQGAMRPDQVDGVLDMITGALDHGFAESDWHSFLITGLDSFAAIADRVAAPALKVAEEPAVYETAGTQPANDQLYIAVRAGMAGCQIGLNVAVKLIQTLQLSGVISAEAARELWLQLEDETFRAVESVPALSQSLDAWLIQGRRLFL
jgi:hypothetical protein